MARPKDKAKIELIYRATLKLVLKEGYTALRMADVAKAARLATGTVYVYFENKEDLVNKLYLHLKTGKTNEMLSAYRGNDSFFVSFKKLWLAYFMASMREPERMVFLEQFARSSYLKPATLKKADELLHPLVNFITEAQRQQHIKDYPVDLILSGLMGAINETVRYFHDHKINPGKKELDASFEMAWNSVRR